MVILGGLEIVAAGYLLKEIAGDSKAEEEQRERERERRRKRRHHSREDGRHNHRYDDSPDRPSRPPSQGLRPPQNPGPQRPNSAPPAQSRPPMMPPMMPPVPMPGAMWQPQPQPQQPQYPPGPQGPMQTHGTWPMMQQQPPPQMPQMPQMPPQQQPFVPPYLNPAINGKNNPNNANFVPPPLQRPQTMYPPPGVHIDLKTGKIQHNMLPPEMQQGKRDLSPPSPPLSRQETSASYERRRTNSGFSDQPQPQFGGVYGEQGYSHSQPQITVNGNYNHAPAPPQAYAELDSETPGRYRPYGNEKASYSTGSGRQKSNSFSSRAYGDAYDTEMRDPPPAYRE